MGIESVMVNLVEGWDRATEIDKAMITAGYEINPYSDIAACIAEAIYHMIGDEGDYENSATSYILNSDDMSREERVADLISCYNKRR